MNMALLVEAIDSDPKLLTLLQESHRPEYKEDFTSLLNQCLDRKSVV